MVARELFVRPLSPAEYLPRHCHAALPRREHRVRAGQRTLYGAEMNANQIRQTPPTGPMRRSDGSARRSNLSRPQSRLRHCQRPFIDRGLMMFT